MDFNNKSIKDFENITDVKNVWQTSENVEYLETVSTDTNSLCTESHKTIGNCTFSVVEKEEKLNESMIITNANTFPKEIDVGISCYICDLSISGIFKNRFSDFLVHEIDIDGNETKLTNTSVPEEENPSVVIDHKVSHLLSCEEWENIRKVADGINDTYSYPVNDMPKDERRKIHNAIKSAFKNIETNTVNNSGMNIIVVTRKTKFSRKDKSKEKFLHFILYKENMDTMTAISVLASKLRKNVKEFSYAGNKDRRAKTSQWVSVRNCTPLQLVKSLSTCSIRVGNFCFKKSCLHLGQLKGNNFTIVLRGVKELENKINETVLSFKNNGFINYFGMQRFGTSCIPTHHIGCAMLSKDWRKVIDLILHPRDNDKSRIEDARREWWNNHDASKALRIVGSYKCPEKQLLEGIKKMGKNDLLGAISCISYQTRLMYLHAYQSYIWNLIASKRIATYGLKVIEDDLIQTQKENFLSRENSNIIQANSSNMDQFSIFDVVLPLPGHNVSFPGNVIQSWYEELLHKDGLTLKSFKQNNKILSLEGAYRKLLIKPENLHWKTCFYADPNDALVLSDSDNLDNIKLNPQIGPYKALILDFTLPSSSYATMALREIVHADTSAYHQSILSRDGGCIILPTIN